MFLNSQFEEELKSQSSNHSFVQWLLDQPEETLVAVECVLREGSNSCLSVDLVLELYQKLGESLTSDPKSMSLARALQDRYVLVGATLFDLARTLTRLSPDSKYKYDLLSMIWTAAPWLYDEVVASADLLIDQLFQPWSDHIFFIESDSGKAELELYLSISQDWLALLTYCRPANALLIQDDRIILELAKTYDTITKKTSSHLDDSVNRLAKQLKWHWTGIAYCVISCAFGSSSSSNSLVANDVSIGAVFLDVLNDMETSETTLVPFTNAPFMLDMEFRFGLRDMLSKALPASLDEAQASYITMSIDQLVSMCDPVYHNGLGSLQKMIEPVVEEEDMDGAKEAENNQLVVQVKELIPDLGNGFVSACLHYYNNDVSAVINSLLEDNLPPSLAEMDRSTSNWTTPTTPIVVGTGTAYKDEKDAMSVDPERPADVLSSRRNIFDHDEFDIFNRGTLDWSQVHRGKSTMQQQQADTDSKLDQQLKSRVMEIARRMEEEDEYDDTYDDTVQDTVVDSPTSDDTGSVPNQKRASDDGHSGKVQQSSAKANDDPIKPWEGVLVKNFVTDPKIFDRSRAARTSASRTQLCQQTGLTHEQIEGWHIMFMRNPRRQNIIDKHVNIGNSNRTAAPTTPTKPPNKKNSDSAGNSETRTIGAAAAKRKERNKSKIANHNRKQQHSRKVCGTLPSEGGS